MRHLTLHQVPLIGADPEILLQNIKHDVIQAVEKGVDYFEYSSITPMYGGYLTRRLDLDPDMNRMNVRVSYNTVNQILGVTVYTMFGGAPCSWLAQELCRNANAHLRLDEQLHLGISPAIGKFRILIEQDTSLPRLGFQQFRGPYTDSCTFPQAYLMAAHAYLPGIVFVTGYTKSYERLLDDKDLWLHGGSFQVSVVILTKWSVGPGGRIECFIEVWRRRDAHAERHVQMNSPRLAFWLLDTD